MRLDKFLKVSRLIKRRTVANEACDAGRVSVNGKPAKASVNVKVGDIIEIAFGTKTVKVRVLDLLDTTKKEQAKDLYDKIDDLGLKLDWNQEKVQHLLIYLETVIDISANKYQEVLGWMIKIQM